MNVHKYIENNCIRKISQYLHNNYNLKTITVKHGYIVIHCLLMFLISFAFIFSNNIVHLIIVLILVSLDAFSVVVLHSCPLTLLEQKYIGESSSDQRRNIIETLNISYNCDHEYEKQVELMINVWLLIAMKCLTIICLRTTNIKLTNYYGLYE